MNSSSLHVSLLILYFFTEDFFFYGPFGFNQIALLLKLLVKTDGSSVLELQIHGT